MKRQNAINIIIMAVFLCIMIAMIVQLFPLLEDVLSNRNDESSIVSTVDALGWRGPPALVGLSALQVIFPLIPAAAVGILTGLTYGVLWGALIFLGGISLGNIAVIFFMRRIEGFFTKRIRHNVKHSGPLSKENLEKIKRPEIVAFFLFMLPYISGAGPYLFAETNVKLWKYIIAVVAGSIPQTIIYVILGDRISQGSYTAAIVIAAIFVVIVAFILLFRKKILKLIMSGSN
jgi:uncharacterized membrane protein YdjX (TVP38/TMEM64 family)